MGKRKKQLSHAQIWDDSALVQSWNDALEEYKLYHSIHARGERIEDVIKDVEAGTQDAELVGDVTDSGAAIAQTDGAMSEDLEDGELVEKPETGEALTNGGLAEKSYDTSMPQQIQPVPQGSNTNKQETQAMPNAITGGVQDEALKNLMMSWYYAGYYTGFYEGQKNAQNETWK